MTQYSKRHRQNVSAVEILNTLVELGSDTGRLGAICLRQVAVTAAHSN